MKYGLPVVAHVIIHNSNQILLARRYRTGYQDGSFGLPGGHLEAGETVKQAARREIWEEVGIEVQEAKLTPIGVSHFMALSGHEGIDFFLATDQWNGQPYAKSECDQVIWRGVDQLPENTIPFVKRAINHHFTTGAWFDEIGWDEATKPFA